MQAQIIIDKVTDPAGDAQLFDFTLSDAGGTIATPQLADGTAPFESGALAAGTYSVVETVPSGWTQTGVECVSSQGNPPATYDPASITLSDGELVTCTFTNEENTLVSLAGLEATASDGGTLVTWTTGAEIDNAGFNIYSSNSADGPWTQVNDSMILAEGDAAGFTSYSITDANGAAYYMLESVDTNGEVTQQGPISADGFIGTADTSISVYIPLF